jgi:hypothetical protein
LISYVNGKPKKLKETDITFNLIDWWIGKKTTYPTLPYHLSVRPRHPLLSRDVNRIRASLQQYEKAAYTREESTYGEHYRGMRISKGLVEEGTYSTTEGLGRQ